MNKSVIKFVAIALTAAVLFTTAALLPISIANPQSPERLPLTPRVVIAQSPAGNRSDQEWQQVYERMPELPREDQYVDRVTRAVAQNSTLVSRLIRYHMFVRSRAPNYRLDWKLTLADYLDANEWMSDSLYPGADTLQPNPINGDRAAIGQLNRAQRDRLVAILVSIFSGSPPEDSSGASVTAPEPSATPTSSPAPIQTQPGAAQLLLPLTLLY